jgi:hypothetical protein
MGIEPTEVSLATKLPTMGTAADSWVDSSTGHSLDHRAPLDVLHRLVRASVDKATQVTIVEVTGIEPALSCPPDTRPPSRLHLDGRAGGSRTRPLPVPKTGVAPRDYSSMSCTQKESNPLARGKSPVTSIGQ